MARKSYTREFKLQALRMITEQGLSVAEAARRLGIRENLLRNWKKAAAKLGVDAFPGHSNLTPEDDELRRLKAEVTRLRARTGSTKKSRRVLRQPTDLTFRFIADNADEWPVSWMCQALEVSESGYYAWATRCPSKAQKRQDALVAAIEVIHTEVKQRYGSPRMTAELNARGYECSENMVAALMRQHGIRARAPKRFVRTTDSRHNLPVAENLLDRDFDRECPNVAWSRGHHLHSDGGRLAVPGRRRGSVQPADRGLVDGRLDGEPVGGRCALDGDPTSSSGCGVADALGSREPVRQRTLPGRVGS